MKPKYLMRAAEFRRRFRETMLPPSSKNGRKEREVMTQERLIKVAQNVLEGSDVDLTAVTPATTLESLGFNSITMLMLMVGIEDEFSITLPVGARWRNCTPSAIWSENH